MGFIFCLLQRRCGPLFVLARLGLQVGCAHPVGQPAIASSKTNASVSVNAVDGQRIAYRTIGHGEITVVLAHCWGCTSALWDGVAARLVGRYRFVLVDLPGHGQSTGTRRAWTVRAYAQDLAAVVDSIGGAPVILVGHSMSGRIVTEAARSSLRGRVRGVVLVDSVPDVAHIAGDAERLSLVARLRADFGGTVHELVSGLEPASAEQPIATVTALIERMDPRVAREVLDQNLSYPFLERLSGLEVPLWSVNASITATDQVANQRLVANWQAVVMPATGHWLMLDAPEQFAAALDAALSAIATQSRERT
ncbi:MAG TPA: alpha/beta hydrolase [Polyangiaceae bacterium]